MTVIEDALIIQLTWTTFKEIGIVLLILALLSLIFGDLPDHNGLPLANSVRKIIWPIFAVWLIVLVVRALVI